jgi:hypothetical protein
LKNYCFEVLKSFAGMLAAVAESKQYFKKPNFELVLVFE